jgi:ABC-type nitrate/sulfonate/bicarbonate transport system substrate-binding protein
MDSENEVMNLISQALLSAIRAALRWSTLFSAAAITISTSGAFATDKLYAIYSAHSLSHVYPWIAQESGIFKKYELEVPLVYVPAGAPAVATILTGDSEITQQGAGGLVRAFVLGNRDLVFIGGVKNILTHSIVGKRDISTPEQLRGKKIGVGRYGSTTHYFAVQVLRRIGLNASDVSLVQTGGGPDTFAALVGNVVDTAALAAPSDQRALELGYHYIIFGPALRIPYAATAYNTRRSIMAKRPQVLARFMRAMAESAKIAQTDRTYTLKVLGKFLRIQNQKVLEASYDSEIKALEPRLAIRADGLKANLDEISSTEPRAKNVQAEEMMDTRYLDEMTRAGFFDQLWATKR